MSPDPEILATHARDLAEARDLAGLLVSIMRQFPTSLDEFDERLACDRLPPWLDEAGHPADTFTEHIIWYGGPDPDHAAGTLEYDDEETCREMLGWVNFDEGGGYAVRELHAGPWVVVEDASTPLSGQEAPR